MSAILTTGFYLTIAIFTFTLLASVAISCNFLNQAFEENQETLQVLSSRYLVRSVSIAFLVLLSAAILFPILPRTHFGEGGPGAGRQTGYTEHVSLDARSSLFGARGGQIMARIERESIDPAKSDMATLLPYGLLRAKVLNSFDGTNWSPGPLRQRRTEISAIQPKARAELSLTHLVITREAMNSDALLVPYGTKALYRDDHSELALHRNNGEWTNPGLRSMRIKYHSEHHIAPPYGGDSVPPYPDHQQLFSGANLAEIKSLAEKIFSSAAGNVVSKSNEPDLAIALLSNYFQHEGYNTSTAEQTTQPNLSALANFLLVTKSGNCELFASSAAILLRMAGVSTRLVTGFRLSRGDSGGTLTFRSGDAHAWIEYWSPTVGWKVFDPTPRTLLQSSVMDHLQDLYDSAESFWYYYVYSYNAQSQMEIGFKGLEKFRRAPAWVANEVSHDLLETEHKNLFTTFAGILVFIVLGLIYLWVRGVRLSALTLFGTDLKKGGALRLVWERKKMERLLRKNLAFPRGYEIDLLRQEKALLEYRGPLAAQAYSTWKNHYLDARFNPRALINSNRIALLKADRLVCQNSCRILA